MWSWFRWARSRWARPARRRQCGLTGPLAEEVLERVGLPVIGSPMAGTSVEWNGWDVRILRGYGVLAPHYEFWLPTAGLAKLWSCLRTGGATPVGCASLEAFRIAEGIPAYGIDMVERDLPQETSQMRALHFTKGCYLGQEIVERIRSRGNVHRHLRPLELSGPVPAGGTELTLEDGDGCRADHQRGRVAARDRAPRLCAGHDARGSGGARTGLRVQGGRTRGNGAHSGSAAEAGQGAGVAGPAAAAMSESGRLEARDGAAGSGDEKLEAMSDTPKFEVIDRRKIKAEEEKGERATGACGAGTDGSGSPAAPASRPLGRAWW